jgi:hypothetical protein
MIEFFFYAGLITAFYVYSGLGLSFLICPKKFEHYSLYFSPIVGLAFLSYVGWFLYEYSPWGTNEYFWIVLILPCIFLIMAVALKRDRLPSLVFPLKKENVILIGVCIVLFCAISFPYYSRIEGISNAISLLNNDIVDYAVISKYLMLSSSSNTPVPNVIQYLPASIEHIWFSAYLSTALPSSILNLGSYQVQNLVTYLFFIFSLPLIFLISTEIFGYLKKSAVFITFLVGINFTLVYLLYQNFLGQTIGMGFFLGLFLVTWYPILKYNNFREIIPYLPLNILFCFGLTMSYQVLLPFFFLPSIVFIGAYFIFSRSKQFFIHALGYLSFTLFFCFLISPFSFINRVRTLFIFSSVEAGWNLPIWSPNWIFGLPDGVFALFEKPLWPSHLHVLMSVLLSIPFIILVLYSISDMNKYDRKLVFLFGCYMIFMLLYYLYLVEHQLSSLIFNGYSYKSFKLISYFIPLILIGGFYCVKDIFDARDKKNTNKRIVILIFLALVILANIISCVGIIYIATVKSEKIKPEIIDLQKIGVFENVTSINVPDNTFWNQMWIFYFLFDKKPVYLKYTTYYPASPQIGEWTLQEVHASDITNLSLMQTKNHTITINQGYYLD